MSEKGRRTPPDRFLGLFLILTSLLVVVGGRLLWLQVAQAPAYAKIAAEQRVRDMVITPKRGVIYDREGEPLAISVEARTVYAVPSAVRDASAVATALAGVLGGQPADFMRALTRKGSFAYVARKVELERAKRLEAADLPGIGFIEDSKRTYPSGQLACQVLGFVNVDDEGIAGLERRYDDLLGGTPGRLLAERDPYGRIIPGGVMKTVDAVDGRDIVLTLDKDIQYAVQLELAGAVEKAGAKSGSAIVMDPRTGEILAMAAIPSFDPNAYRTADPRAFRNRATVDVYEPGSTAKPFTAAAVIDRNLFTPESAFDLPSTIRVGDRIIGEAHDRPGVRYSLTDIIAKSSNVGAVKLGLALGKRGIYDYFGRFGFMEQTGIDFPGEARGFTPRPEKWSASSIGNIPFGQGMTVSVLQLARGYSALANGGELVTPHFLLSVPGEDTSTVWPKRRAVGEETARRMVQVLTRVVADGSGGQAAVPGYEVAGKTGTAQKAKDGSYKDGGFVASFVGFLPAGDPKVLVAVVVDEPVNGHYGGNIAAPAFSGIGRFCMTHLKIPPASPVTSGTPVPGGQRPGDGMAENVHD